MERLYEIVKDHLFFQDLQKQDTLSLLQQCQQKMYKRQDIIFHANEQRRGLLLLLSGSVEVYVGDRDSPEVLEVLKPGELIGLSSVADLVQAPKRDSEFMVEVRATEPTEVLEIPYPVIQQRLKNETFHQYLCTQLAARLKDIYGSLAEQVALNRKSKETGTLVLKVDHIMSYKLISVNTNTPIEEVAKKMTDNRTSSVLVLEDNIIQGIITERDIVSRVIAQKKSYHDPAHVIMTKNPITISKFAYYYEALSTLILHRIKHLPVLHQGEVVGMVTLSDLMRKKSDCMMKTIQTIEVATEETLPVVKDAIYEVVDALLDDHVPIYTMLDSVTKLYDRLVTRCIEIALEKLQQPPVPFCFYQMGSAGRKEQFLLTDQDHFLLYDRPDNPEEAKNYFEKLSVEIVRLLEKAGYERCKGEMMSSNARWRGSIETWLGRIASWSLHATNQNLLYAQNFFSYRFLYGNEELHKRFEHSLVTQLKGSKIFLFRLHEMEKEHQIPTIDRPIRSLFGLKRKQLDMKKEILFPYHHNLQMLSLIHGIISGTPFNRIDALVEKKALDLPLGKDIKSAMEEIMRVYVKQRWNQYKNKEQLTSILNFSHLTTREKEELIISIKTLKEIQNLVNLHF